MRAIHRYLGLAAAAFWLLQAVTGVVLVFHDKLDDFSVRGPARALDPTRFGIFLQQLQAANADRSVPAVFASGSVPGRFDVLIHYQTGKSDVWRIDGEGDVLRKRPLNHDYPHTGTYRLATNLHQTLFLGQMGRWLVGLSGLLLLSNIGFGLCVGWPSTGNWRRALTPVTTGARVARWYSWHRAVGLWLAIPVFTLVCAGVLMAYQNPLALWFDDQRPPPSLDTALREPANESISITSSLELALHLYAGAELTAMELPTPVRPWFAIALTQPAERPRSGTTVVYVSSRSGRVLANYDARELPMKTRVWDSLYSFHTGEIGGLVGQLAVVLAGVWLLSMIGLGLTLWARRRAHRRSATHRSGAVRPRMRPH